MRRKSSAIKGRKSRRADSRFATVVVIDYDETRTEQIPELIPAPGEPASPVWVLLAGRSSSTSPRHGLVPID